MKRRLYFLFPYHSQVLSVVQQFNDLGVESTHMHTIAKDEAMIDNLPRSTERQRSDAVWRLEWMGWNTNMVIFLMALIGLVVALVASAMLWVMVCALIMALTFVLGQWFTDRVPSVHLTEFHDALAHGEILLMVDVPVWRARQGDRGLCSQTAPRGRCRWCGLDHRKTRYLIIDL